MSEDSVRSALIAVNDEWERMRNRIAELEAALREIAYGYTSELYDRPLAFKMSRMARKALTSSKR